MVLDNNTIDAIIALSMAFMAVSLLFLVSTVLFVMMKGLDTLSAVTRLCDTVNQEVGPTAVQLREVMDGVNQIRGATTQRITAVGSKVEDVAGGITTAVDKVQKESNVLGAGLLAGLRTYLGYKPHMEGSDKQITMDKGEHHE